MTEGAMIVLRLTGSPNDGVWTEMPPAWDRSTLAAARFDPLTGDLSHETVRLVATGNVEWDGDRCAEVWVPEHALALWRAEHDVDA